MTFSHLVSAFFTNYMASERGLSDNTIASYSDCMKLLVKFACERFGGQPEQLDITQLSRDLVIDFLDDLERTRKNGVSTRNLRLTAIKTFFHFLARNVPQLMHLSEKIQAIREKRADNQPPTCLTVPEVDAILAQIDPGTVLGARDNAMLQLLYNTGARVQEVADLTIDKLRFDSAALVTLTGKGNKTRVVPLRQETVEAITHYLQLRRKKGIESNHLFLNINQQPITRFGIGRRVDKYTQKARRRCPSLRHRRVTPHVFRHTIALHLLEAGNNIVDVQNWLGHEDLKTTSQYIEISIERKRAALEKLPPPHCGELPEEPRWKKPELMEFLCKLSRGAMLRKSGSRPKNAPRATA